VRIILAFIANAIADLLHEPYNLNDLFVQEKCRHGIEAKECLDRDCIVRYVTSS